MTLSLEDKIRLIQYDFMNLRKELSELQKILKYKNEFVDYNLGLIADKIDISLKKKIECLICKGTLLYASCFPQMPDECYNCHKLGYVWI